MGQLRCSCGLFADWPILTQQTSPPPGERSPHDRSIGQLPHRLGCVAVGCGQAGAAGAEYGAIVGRAVQSGRGGDVNGVEVDQSSALKSARRPAERMPDRLPGRVVPCDSGDEHQREQAVDMIDVGQDRALDRSMTSTHRLKCISEGRTLSDARGRTASPSPTPSSSK
jgi:hypothetical protein